MYVATAYVCFLLLKYYQAYAILRQRYMTGGEAMINQWHDRICNGPKCANGKASPDDKNGKEGTRMWNAFRELVDVNAQVGSAALQTQSACPECLKHIFYLDHTDLS